MSYQIQNFDEELVNFIRTGAGSPYYGNLSEQVIGVIYELGFDSDSKVLDIGAGNTASITKGIVKVLPQIEITCVDELINIVELESNISWIQTDMMQDDLVLGQFDAIFWIAPYLGDSWFDGSFEKLVHKLGKNLKPQGLFMLDMFNFQNLEIGFSIEKQAKNNTTTFIKSSTDKYEGKRTFLDGKTMDLIWKVFTDQELESIFKQSGFKLKKRLHSFGENLPENIKKMINYQKIPRNIYIFEKS